MTVTTLYGLLDPRTQELRYIGKTSKSIEHRLERHCHPKKTDMTHRAKWIRSLRVLGLRPVMEVFDAVPGVGAAEEVAMIGIAKALGCRVTNHTEGGDGAPGLKHSDESRARMSAARKGVPKSEEWRAKIGAAHVGMKRTPEARARMSAAQRGKKMPPRSVDAIEKTAAAHRGKKRSAEARARISEGIKRARALKIGVSNAS